MEDGHFHEKQRETEILEKESFYAYCTGVPMRDAREEGKTMNTKIIKRDSLSKQVSDKLESMIESGTYLVGERIPTEPELMEMFQVSRNTVREAVQSLTWAGILEVKQGDGTYVRSSNRFQANMTQKYSQVDLEDIRETRNCLEVSIAHLAAQRRNQEDIAKLEAALLSRKCQKTDVKEDTKADLDFHMTIDQACHNVILIDVYKSLHAYLESQIAERNMASQLTAEQIDNLHEVLCRAIVDGDPERAAFAVQKILEI